MIRVDAGKVRDLLANTASGTDSWQQRLSIRADGRHLRTQAVSQFLADAASVGLITILAPVHTLSAEPLPTAPGDTEYVQVVVQVGADLRLTSLPICLAGILGDDPDPAAAAMSMTYALVRQAHQLLNSLEQFVALTTAFRPVLPDVTSRPVVAAVPAIARGRWHTVVQVAGALGHTSGQYTAGLLTRQPDGTWRPASPSSLHVESLEAAVRRMLRLSGRIPVDSSIR
ncbi:hypothetical protein AB0B66_10535 [Catellatospora sp. NPDC049111]|uniref:hypothetical protein n=1 Tax=Catellatospora sp. NPDC049111 TaxID=3155271 RepID=UPI0033C9D559